MVQPPSTKVSNRLGSKILQKLDVDEEKGDRPLESQKETTSGNALLTSKEENSLQDPSSSPLNSDGLFPFSPHSAPAEYGGNSTEDVDFDNYCTKIPLSTDSLQSFTLPLPISPHKMTMSEPGDSATAATDAEKGCDQRSLGFDMTELSTQSPVESKVDRDEEGTLRHHWSSATEQSYLTKPDACEAENIMGNISTANAMGIPDTTEGVRGGRRSGKGRQAKGATEAVDKGRDEEKVIALAFEKAARIQRANKLPRKPAEISTVAPIVDARFRTVSSPLSQVFPALTPVTADPDERENTPPGSPPVNGKMFSPATPVLLIKRDRFRERSQSEPSTPTVMPYEESGSGAGPCINSPTLPQFSLLRGSEQEFPSSLPTALLPPAHIPISAIEDISLCTPSFTASPITPLYSYQSPEYPDCSLSTSLKAATSERFAERDAQDSTQHFQEKSESDLPVLMYSLWDYLKEELTTTEVDVQNDTKGERVANFLDVPGDFEKLMLFGYVVCLDAFLYIFTILPIRLILAVVAFGRRILKRNRSLLGKAHLCDLFRGIIFLATCLLLEQVDASKLYHSIRGQAVIKLYVIFNVLEILDRLCCSFGQDILDSFYARISNDRDNDTVDFTAQTKSIRLRFVPHFALAMGYVFTHSIVLFYQVVTLNVAINSHSNALLTLLLSNQFVEIKGSVFKKFERENLFQLSCSDIVERFQLSVFLTIITLRNLLELSASSSPLLPSSFPRFLPAYFSSVSVIESLIAPVAVVTVSELVVDWLKHAFITKFNGIRPSAYGRFVDVLCRDLVKAGSKVAEEHTENRRRGSLSTWGIGRVSRSRSVVSTKEEGFAITPIIKDLAPVNQSPQSSPFAQRKASNVSGVEEMYSDSSSSYRGIRGQRNDAPDDQNSCVVGEEAQRMGAKNDRLTEDTYIANGKVGTESGDRFDETAKYWTQHVSHNAKEASAPSNQRHTLVDQSRVVSRRLGFASMPLACLVIRVLSQTLRMVEFFAQNDDGDEEGFFTSSSASPTAAAPPVATSSSSTLVSITHLANIFLSVLATLSTISTEYLLPLLQWFWNRFTIFSLEQMPVEWATWCTASWSGIARLYQDARWPPAWVKWMGFDNMEWITGLMATVEQRVFEKWNWATVLEVGLWVMVAVVIYACLVSLKLLVGIHLLNFAHRRLEGIMEREATDEAVAKKEKMDRDAERRRLHQEFSDRPGTAATDSVWMTSNGATPVTLHNIERYTLFKSRIP